MREIHQVSLALLTTLQVGGTARRVLDAENEREIIDSLAEMDSTHEPVFILGGGSNVIAPDAGWPGTILRPAIRNVSAQCEEQQVILEVGAGENWDDIVAQCVDNGWAGLSCLSGIPGWAGAAPVQNIGAYGCEVRDVLVDVHAVDRRTRTTTRMSVEECSLGYRNSCFRGNDRFVLTSITLRLRREQGEIIRYAELARALGVAEGTIVPSGKTREAVLALRHSKGMVVSESDAESHSAGSYFVNPVVDASTLEHVERFAIAKGVVESCSLVPRFQVAEGRYKIPAAWLIEKAGFRKGMTLGGAGISRKHALAIVNRGGTATDVLTLEETIRRGVLDQFGVELRREPILMQDALLENHRP